MFACKYNNGRSFRQEVTHMSYQTRGAKALFLAADGQIYPDVLICSGVLPEQLHGEPCPYAENGRLPTPLPLNKDSPDYSRDKGEPGDLCPPCVRENWCSLGQWQGENGFAYPPELSPLRLFKCRQNLWLVMPGLYEATPNQILQIEAN
jgi:hypothetical protein